MTNYIIIDGIKYWFGDKNPYYKTQEEQEEDTIKFVEQFYERLSK